MKTINAAGLAHLAQRVTSLAVCWRVQRNDGVLILGTEHPLDITIAPGDSPDLFGGTYKAGAGISGSDLKSADDLAVDNSEVTGSYNRDLTIVDLRAEDIEAGLFDLAAVTVFVCNWKAPDDFQIILGAGTLGDIIRTAEGQYRTERRGLAQALTKNFVRTFGIDCDAIFGDARCMFDLATVTFAGVVTAVTNRREFTATIDPSFDETQGRRGYVLFTYGANEGFREDVKQTAAGVVTLYLPMPREIEVGDTFNITQGCDFKFATCKDVYDNLYGPGGLIGGFRGHGFYVPGQHEILKIGGQESSGNG